MLYSETKAKAAEQDWSNLMSLAVPGPALLGAFQEQLLWNVPGTVQGNVHGIGLFRN